LNIRTLYAAVKLQLLKMEMAMEIVDMRLTVSGEIAKTPKCE